MTKDHKILINRGTSNEEIARRYAERLKRIEREKNKPKPTPKENIGTVVGELGKDYGLIFVNRMFGQIKTTVDGKTTDIIADKDNYHRLFFDNQGLYYTRGTCLCKWPEELIYGFGEIARGITNYCNEILVVLQSGRILNSRGTIFKANLAEPSNITVFNNELYHTSDKGLVKTLKDKSISTAGSWTKGLAALDNKLYFGGFDRTIYSYDGNKVETVCNTDFEIWSLHGAKGGNRGLIYACGFDKQGILVVSLDNLENQRTILENQAYKVGSIISAPIDFIKKLNEEAQNGTNQ